MVFSTQSYLELALRKNKKKKLPKGLAPRTPKNLEREYQRELIPYLELIKRSVELYIIPQLPKLVNDMKILRPGHMKEDAAPDDLDRLIAEAKKYLQLNITVDQIKRLTTKTALDVSTWNKELIAKNIKRVVGIDPYFGDSSIPNEVALFTLNNTNLITSVSEKAYTDIATKVFTGFQQGTRAEDLADDILKYVDPSVGNTRARADLIARDQVNKLNGQLTQLRQTELGINRYRWRSMKDERVRESHADNDGKIFSWDDPPADTGHPGDDFQCRCYAEPVLEDLIPGIENPDE